MNQRQKVKDNFSGG